MFTIKRLLGQIRRAIQDYDMIQEGDRIAVGVSGGKDSLALLVALRQIKNFLPVKFELEAVTLTMGIGEFDLSPVKELCKKIDVNYTIEETLIGKIVFEERQEKNPCSLCANLRRGALHNTAKRLGCNKVALAHHMDDVIETFLLSTFYEGRIHTFSPVTYLDRKGLYLIRPLIYTEEKLVKEFIKGNNITTVHNPCPANGYTKRQYIKDLLWDLKKDNREIKSNIFGAIKRSGIDNW
ncbi:MAG TPA: tRNA 2-thiocytidine(32) synthetase TtcA [Clostridium sp.]|uniref:tRNA 2-thiocytidine(32) synthetase TtcA n=2 Tax=Acetivibrio mesophilus TaxID=2487273 RepID=A0A4Q0I8A7_9FIRM|nr:tRNA 2-thiocytidine biosynthesis protein TtcA [Clostridium sp. Bc-iso-3]RXE59232.1 tRNA 2-thiocytidine(32) synthetase TtcA [Acetivibrio mesophilus]HHV28818.1 tRNA 2-thiocytidine(32) synthetase TtcA [Clostridium sp.]